MSDQVRYRIVIGSDETEQDIRFQFTYRLLGREEYEGLLQNNLSDEELLEAICYLCVEEQYDFSHGFAGIPEVIGSAILEGSGYLEGQSELLLSMFRGEVEGNANVQRDCIIVEAFPKYDIEDVANWPLTKQLWVYARAEYILKLRGREIREVSLEERKAMQQIQQAPRQQAREEEISFKAPPQQQQAAPQAKQETNPQRELTEAEVMAMLGVGMHTVATDIDRDSMKYYSEKDKLTGDFD